jgi:hypothetical protein
MSQRVRPDLPAFPKVVPNADVEFDDGINIRTYLAGQCIAGLLLGASEVDVVAAAKFAVSAADALIAELNKETP